MNWLFHFVFFFHQASPEIPDRSLEEFSRIEEILALVRHLMSRLAMRGPFRLLDLGILNFSIIRLGQFFGNLVPSLP